MSGLQSKPLGPAGLVCRTVCMFLALSILIGCQPPKSSSDGTDRPVGVKPTGEAVTLVVDFDDGQQRHFRLAWREGMTVLDALDSASQRQRGITYTQRGTGEMAMITAIDALANEGGGKGRNWIYRVNGQLADKSCGVYEIRPEDVILWKFGTYD
jgi:hypothetical protein